jgi:hypothetical protein
MKKKIIKLLEEAEKVRNSGMIFNNKYTVEAGLSKICKLVNEALQLAKQLKEP